MNRIKQHFIFLWNGGLKPDQADLVELRERRTLSSMVLLLSPVGFVVVASNILAGFGNDNFYILLGLLLIFLSLYVQAYFHSRLIAVNLLLSAFWMMPAAVMQGYGVQGTSMMWLFPHSAIAVLMSGPRNGLIWAAICSLTIIVYGYLHSQGQIAFSYGDHNFVAEAGIPNAIEGIFIIAILTGAALLFRKRQNETEIKFNSLVDKLKSEVLSRRLAEQDAKLSEQSKSAFLAAMSHEIRTPLNGVISATRLMVDARTGKDREEYSEIVLGSSETLLELVNDVMDLSAMESGQLNISKDAISPRDVFTSTLKPLRFQAKQKGIGLELSIAQDVPEYILADKTRAKQVLINLIGNSIKFTKEGKVSVSVFMELNKMVLVVEDTGIGISEAEQSKLFEPFVQANTATRGVFGGSGLGLTIVKKILNAVKGNIVLESELGKGSKFSVYIPYAIPNASSIEKLNRSQLVPLDLPPLNLLIADDNAVNRMVLARLLENDNHKVVAVNDGQEALNYIRAHNVDAVLMDIQMPIMDGEQAAAEIRKLPEPTSKTTIIAITANANSDDAKRFLSSHFDGFLAKPFRREALIEVLQSTLTKVVPDA
jgi:signal transduction histidine kinase/ActR/RegA family two-component response regulator